MKRLSPARSLVGTEPATVRIVIVYFPRARVIKIVLPLEIAISTRLFWTRPSSRELNTPGRVSADTRCNFPSGLAATRTRRGGKPSGKRHASTWKFFPLAKNRDRPFTILYISIVFYILRIFTRIRNFLPDITEKYVKNRVVLLDSSKFPNFNRDYSIKILTKI